MKTENEQLLSVRDLSVEFQEDRGKFLAVDGISFDVNSREIIGIVGESGCGKTVSMLALLGLVAPPAGRVTRGRIIFEGRDLRELSRAEMQNIRGNKIAMIFQEPMTALNPVFTIGSQITDILRRHKRISRSDAWCVATQLLRDVQIAEAEEKMNDYPHQLSGGMRSRVMIAMALSCNPRLVIADEPTTAIDVTTQTHCLALFERFQQESGVAFILVTHDLKLVAEICERVIVMYCGKILESALVRQFFGGPLHPYSRGLMESIPRIRRDKLARLPTIEGRVPDPFDVPKGCVFSDRCVKAQMQCKERRPSLEGSPERKVACFFPCD